MDDDTITKDEVSLSDEEEVEDGDVSLDTLADEEDEIEEDSFDDPSE
ncbi:MAG: hypothetical protein HQ402_00120 [Parcubacteria group bacterium]|nr:hypothetical protein [Parcubacteria group bacterium]